MGAPKPKNGAGRDLKQAIGVGVLLGALAVSYTHLTLPMKRIV